MTATTHTDAELRALAERQRAARFAAAIAAHDSLPQRLIDAQKASDEWESAALAEGAIAQASAPLLAALAADFLPSLLADLRHAQKAEDEAHAHHIAACRGRVRDQLHMSRLVEALQSFIVGHATDDAAALDEALQAALSLLVDERDERVHGAARQAGLLAGGRECAEVSP